MERLRQGDQNALAEVRKLHAPWVAAVICRRYPVFSEADVDDVLAVAVFRLWQGRHRLDRAKGQLSALFCRIALRTAADVCRHGWQKARRLEVPIDSLCGIEPAAKLADTESSAIATPKKIEDLRRIIDTLPDSYRQIVLADIGSRDQVASVEYLAAELDAAPGTVRVYRARAYATIRKEMQELGYEVP